MTTIDAARAEKLKIERTVEELLFSFSDKYGLKIDDIHLLQDVVSEFGGREKIVSAKCEILVSL